MGPILNLQDRAQGVGSGGPGRRYYVSQAVPRVTGLVVWLWLWVDEPDDIPTRDRVVVQFARGQEEEPLSRVEYPRVILDDVDRAAVPVGHALRERDGRAERIHGGYSTTGNR